MPVCNFFPTLPVKRANVVKGLNQSLYGQIGQIFITMDFKRSTSLTQPTSESPAAIRNLLLHMPDHGKRRTEPHGPVPLRGKEALDNFNK